LPTVDPKAFDLYKTKIEFGAATFDFVSTLKVKLFHWLNVKGFLRRIFCKRSSGGCGRARDECRENADLVPAAGLRSNALEH
jgi:hypothetical protein